MGRLYDGGSILLDAPEFNVVEQMGTEAAAEVAAAAAAGEGGSVALASEISEGGVDVLENLSLYATKYFDAVLFDSLGVQLKLSRSWADRARHRASAQRSVGLRVGAGREEGDTVTNRPWPSKLAD